MGAAACSGRVGVRAQRIRQLLLRAVRSLDRDRLAVQQLTSLGLAAAVKPIPPRPAFPTPGQQLSPTTNFVDWMTGNYLPNNTFQRFSIWGTVVGVMWDNGIADDPDTPFNEHQVLTAVETRSAGRT
jgi:hypothetical protein